MKYFVILIASLTLPSCLCGGGGSILPSLQTRAAFELDCPKEKLSIEPLDNWSVKGVSGCGKRAVYVYINGQWLRNSDGQDGVIQAAKIEEVRREMEEQMEKQRDEEERRRDEEEWQREMDKFGRELRKAANDRP
jgi:hypothetical protein